MRISILIGVSEYQDKNNNLPACKHDVSVMNELLKATEEYTDILVIDGSSKSAVKVKSILSDWFEKYRDIEEEIEEIFFYYTGHGEFYEDELHFLLSDFDSKRRKQTSLSNTELDDWLRSLGAQLTVKVIDAYRDC